MLNVVVMALLRRSLLTYRQRVSSAPCSAARGTGLRKLPLLKQQEFLRI